MCQGSCQGVIKGVIEGVPSMGGFMIRIGSCRILSVVVPCNKTA